MGVIETLGMAMGTSWTAGINLYATIAALGLAHRMEMMKLPAGLEVLADPMVIMVAVVLYVVEFFADKVPVLDSGWDAFHTFIRVPAGAVLVARAMGSVEPNLELVAGLLGGGVSLASHGTKAASRLAINASPEPFSNWAASIAEDFTAIGALWVAFNYPLLMLVFVVAFLGVAAYLIPKIIGAFRTLFRKLFGGAATEPAPPAAGL